MRDDAKQHEIVRHCTTALRMATLPEVDLSAFRRKLKY